MSQKAYDLAFLISDLGNGGSQRVLHRLLEHWGAQAAEARGKKIAVITLSKAESDFYRLPEGVDRYSIDAAQWSANKWMGLWANISRVRRLRQLFRTIQPQKVFSFICTTNILAILASVGLPHRLIISERNDPSLQSFGKMWDLLRRRLYRFSDVITANSQGALASMRDYVPLEKLRWLPNPVRASVSSEVIQFDSPTLLAVGRLHHQKAYDVLLEAVAIFLKDYPDWRLVVLGEGGLKQKLLQQAETLGIADQVVWRGEVKDPFPYYRGADVFALPSRHEGVPNAMLEAMSCGLPVVVSDASPGPREYVMNGANGILFPNENVRALADALGQLAGSELLRKRLGQAALASMEAHTFDSAVSSWESLLGPVESAPA